MRKLLSKYIQLVLAAVGVILIAASNTFKLSYWKIQTDQLLAELGALLLVIGVLHFIFDLRLREEMLKDVSTAVLGHARFHECGLTDFLMNSHEIKETDHWVAAANLTIGLHYSPRFVDDFHWVIEKRAQMNRPTLILMLEPTCAAAQYLKGSNTGIADVEHGLSRIQQVITETTGANPGAVTVKHHSKVLRYSFIRTDEAIWIKLYTNSSWRTTVPAFKVRSGTPLFEFFNKDIQTLEVK